MIFYSLHAYLMDPVPVMIIHCINETKNERRENDENSSNYSVEQVFFHETKHKGNHRQMRLFVKIKENSPFSFLYSWIFLEWKDWEDYSLGNLFIFSLCTKRRTNTKLFPRPGTILIETHTNTMTESNRNDQSGFSSIEIRELMKNDLGLCYSLPCSINSKCNDTHCFVFLTLIFEIYWIQ